MGLINNMARWVKGMITKDAQKNFEVESIISAKMEREIDRWGDIYQGKPEWTVETGIESFDFAKFICNYTSKLVMLAVDVNVEGSQRANYLKKKVDIYIDQMKKEWVEKACAYGHIVLKPNGSGINYILPMDYCPTAVDEDGNICAAVFADHYHDIRTEKYFTRLEYHRFEHMVPLANGKKVYVITNRVYKSISERGQGELIDIAESPWADMEEETYIDQLEKPLFSIFALPTANNIDLYSHIPVSLFSGAIQELKNLDIAHTRMMNETFDSEKKVFLGDMLLQEPGAPVKGRGVFGSFKDRIGKVLPRYIHILPGSSTGEEYHEINPVLQTDARVAGVNHWLNLVGVKCGYSAGQFVLNGHTGQITATQVEADDRETIQTIKSIRDSLKTATENLIYALDAYASLYDLAPLGKYETSYDWGDITYNVDEDRMRHWQYVQQGKYPLYRYYMEFEGMSEEEAKQVVAEAEEAKRASEGSGLFGEE